MLYKIEIEDKVIAENLTLGQAFTCVDKWCYDNKASYKLSDMMICMGPNNTLEIEIYPCDSNKQLPTITIVEIKD